VKKKVHLVLGSGGARGIAHIGVIEQLEKEGYEIIEIIGCSMGAVVGGIYAAGHLPEYKDWLLSLSRSDVFDLMDFTFTKMGFVKGEKLFAKHKEVTGDLQIEDFSIPFTAVATDMRHNEEVYFRSGNLYKALRASVSIPGLFTPVVQDGKVLVDGGVLNPVPVNLVDKKEDAIIVAVDLNARATEPELVKSKKKDNEEAQKWYERLIPDQVIEFAKNREKQEEEAFSLLELMESTFSFTQDRLTSLMFEMYKPDILINIPRNTCGTFDFYKAKEIYQTGIDTYNKTKKDID
jgi:NTE family protein